MEDSNSAPPKAKATATTTSTESLFRTLRAPAHHKEKITLARAAWEDDRVELPRKAHFLCEWLLERLFRTRDENDSSEVPPVLDHQYWSLLRELLDSSSSSTGRSTAVVNAGRPSHGALDLRAILAKAPVVPILAAFLHRLASLRPETTTSQQVALIAHVQTTSALLLPLSIHYASSSSGGALVDSLCSCLKSYISHSPNIVLLAEDGSRVAKHGEEELSSSSGLLDTWTRISTLLLSAIDRLVSNDKNLQKRAVSNYLSSLLPALVATPSQPDQSIPAVLGESFSRITAHLYLSPWNLQRLLVNSNASFTDTEAAARCLSELFEAFTALAGFRRSASATAKQSPQKAGGGNISSSSVPNNRLDAILSFLPGFFRTFVSSVQSHNYELFKPRQALLHQDGASSGQPSSSSYAAQQRSTIEVHVVQQTRYLIFAFLKKSLQIPTTQTQAPATSSTAAFSRVMLSILRESSVYSAGHTEGHREWLQILQSYAGQLISLAAADNEAALDCIAGFSILADINFAALEERLPEAFSVLASLPAPTVMQSPQSLAIDRKGKGKEQNLPYQNTQSPSAAPAVLVQKTIHYYSKTKNLPRLLRLLRETAVQFLAASSERRTSSANTEHLAVFRSSILSIQTRDLLRREMQTSLAHTQLGPLVEDLARTSVGILQAMQGSTGEIAASADGNGEDRPTPNNRKKRKTNTGSATSPPHDATKGTELQAMQYLSIVQLLQTVLESQEQAQATLAEAVKGTDFENLLTHTLETFSEMWRTGATSNGPPSAKQTALAAVLQLLRAAKAVGLVAQERPPLQDLLEYLETHRNEKLAAPLLKLESIRLLLDCRLVEEQYQVVFDSCLDVLNQDHTGRTDEALHWDGYLHDLSPEVLPVAVWKLLAEQHLAMLEQYASDPQLKAFQEVLMEHPPPLQNVSAAGPGIDQPLIAYRVLRNAGFYELPRLQAAMTDLLRGARLGSSHLPMLLLFPKDYLDRRTRRHILEQCSKPFSDSRQDVEAARSQVLIQYVSDDPGNPLSQDLPYLTALATHREGVAQPNLFATLVRLLFQNWNSSTDKYASLTPSILRVLIKDEKNLKKAAKDAIKGNDSVLRPYMEVLRILISETRFESLPDAVQTELQKEHQMLQTVLLPLLDATDVKALSSSLELVNVVQQLGEWTSEGQLVQGTTVYVGFAKQALSTYMQATASTSTTNSSTRTGQALLDLISRNVARDSGAFSFEGYAVAYMIITQKYDLSTAAADRLAATTLAQPEDRYKQALDTLQEALNPSQSSGHLIAGSLAVLGILVCNPPEGASRIASQAISVILRQVSLLQPRTLPLVEKVAVTTFIKKVCEQRISVFELLDISSIWALAYDLCHPAGDDASMNAECTESTEAASPALLADQLFSNLISITSMVATYRRDHLIATFPQFVAVLTLLLNVLRLPTSTTAVVHQVDLKTQEKLRSTFPSWAFEHGLAWIRKSHAKALSRLLVNLNTKTTLLQKSRKASSEATGAAVVSLSGPLSKHSPFLLANILRFCTDSSFAISSQTRKDLLPGILEIIQCMNKYEKEALMRGFLRQNQDAERTLLGELWKDYDKIRYRGD